MLFLHEHAEANDHKNNGLAAILAGHASGLKTGMHSKVTLTIGDLHATLADEVLNARIGIRGFPSAERKVTGII